MVDPVLGVKSVISECFGEAEAECLHAMIDVMDLHVRAIDALRVRIVALEGEPEFEIGKNENGEKFIRHNRLGCRRESYHPEDIHNGYCAVCGKYATCPMCGDTLKDEAPHHH